MACNDLIDAVSSRVRQQTFGDLRFAGGWLSSARFRNSDGHHTRRPAIDQTGPESIECRRESTDSPVSIRRHFIHPAWVELMDCPPLRLAAKRWIQQLQDAEATDDVMREIIELGCRYGKWSLVQDGRGPRKFKRNFFFIFRFAGCRFSFHQDWLRVTRPTWLSIPGNRMLRPESHGWWSSAGTYPTRWLSSGLMFHVRQSRRTPVPRQVCNIVLLERRGKPISGRNEINGRVQFH